MLFVIGMFCFLYGIYVPISEFLLFSMVFMLWIDEFSRRCLNMFWSEQFCGAYILINQLEQYIPLLWLVLFASHAPPNRLENIESDSFSVHYWEIFIESKSRKCNPLYWSYKKSYCSKNLKLIHACVAQNLEEIPILSNRQGKHLVLKNHVSKWSTLELPLQDTAWKLIQFEKLAAKDLRMS